MTILAHVLASAFAALQTTGAPAQSGPLTLDQAIAIAQRNAFTVQLQQSTIEINRQRAAQAKANMGPKVAITGTYTRYQEAQTSNFGGQTVVVQPIDNKSINASVTMPIDISGNLGRQVQAANRNVAAAESTLNATVSDVRMNTKTAYFNVLRNEGLVQVAQQGVSDAEERLKQANQLFAQDQIAKVDVDRFESQLAQARADLIAAQNNLQLAQNQFNFVLARPIETPVELAPITDLPPVTSTDDALVQKAQSQRPEVTALNYTIQGLALSRRALEAGMNPSLNASIQNQRTIDAQGFNARSSTTFGQLVLSVPIWDSGLTRARVKEARQNELQAQINLRQLELSISQEVRNAVRNLQGALARLNNAEAQVKLAEEVYRLAKIKQDAGAGTYVEVIDAETSLTQARNQLVSARYDYLTAYAQLQRAVGSDNVNSTGGGAK